LNILESITGDSKSKRNLLIDNKDIFKEHSSYLFGEKIEDQIAK